MGVTKGGLLVPRPFQYDWEVFREDGAAGDTYLTAAALSIPTVRSTITILTRVPRNAAIVDFDKLYYVIRETGYGSTWITISIKNLRTAQIIATHAYAFTSGTPWVVESFALSKTNPMIPGDPLEITIDAPVSQDAIHLRTYQKRSLFATSGLFASKYVGQAFPSAKDSNTPYYDYGYFHMPALFLTWKDADDNVITEWMPGLLPMEDRVSATDPGGVRGNEMTMPFTDRRPSGFWFYGDVTDGPYKLTGGLVTILAEPTSPGDFNELYTFSLETQAFIAIPRGMFYCPFDGLQPRLAKGRKYIVGVRPAATAQFCTLYRHKWIPGTGSVHLGFDDRASYVEWASGAWTWFPGWHGEFGLVFEESET